MTLDLCDLHRRRPRRRDRRLSLQRSNSSSGIVNLWDLPARITSCLLPPLPISQVIEQSKKPCFSPSITIISRCASASAIWPRCVDEIGALGIVQQRLHVLDGRG